MDGEHGTSPYREKTMIKIFANLLLIIGLSLGASTVSFAQDRDRDKKEKPPEKIKENPKPNDNRDRGNSGDKKEERPKRP